MSSNPHSSPLQPSWISWFAIWRWSWETWANVAVLAIPAWVPLYHVVAILWQERWRIY